MPVGAGAGNPQDPAQPLDAEAGAVAGDEVPAAGPHSTSPAKQAAARRRISRSICHSFSALRQPGVLRPQPGRLTDLTLRAAPAPNRRHVRRRALADPCAQVSPRWPRARRPRPRTCACRRPSDTAPAASLRNSSGCGDGRLTSTSLPGPSRSIVRVSTSRNQPYHRTPPWRRCGTCWTSPAGSPPTSRRPALSASAWTSTARWPTPGAGRRAPGSWPPRTSPPPSAANWTPRTGRRDAPARAAIGAVIPVERAQRTTRLPPFSASTCRTEVGVASAAPCRNGEPVRPVDHPAVYRDPPDGGAMHHLATLR